MAFTVFPSTLAALVTLNSGNSPQERIVAAHYGDGYGQFAQDGLNAQYDMWNIEIAPLNSTLKSTWDTFYSTVGTTQVFTWTPPGEVSSKKWRITPKSIKVNFVRRSGYRITFTAEQQFDLGT